MTTRAHSNTQRSPTQCPTQRETSDQRKPAQRRAPSTCNTQRNRAASTQPTDRKNCNVARQRESAVRKKENDPPRAQPSKRQRAHVGRSQTPKTSRNELRRCSERRRARAKRGKRQQARTKRDEVAGRNRSSCSKAALRRRACGVCSEATTRTNQAAPRQTKTSTSKPKAQQDESLHEAICSEAAKQNRAATRLQTTAEAMRRNDEAAVDAAADPGLQPVKADRMTGLRSRIASYTEAAGYPRGIQPLNQQRARKGPNRPAVPNENSCKCAAKAAVPGQGKAGP